MTLKDERSEEEGSAASPAAAREVFGERAGNYARLDVFSEEKYYQPLIDFARPRPGDRVLDLATGPGVLAAMLARQVKQVTGSDVTPEMLKMAAGRARQAGLANIDFVEAEAAHLPFPDDSFDLIVCRTAFHHFPQPRRALAEAYRVLAPAGRLVLADVVGDYGRGQNRALRERLEKLIDPSHMRVYTVEEFEEMLRQAGFMVKRTREPDGKPMPVEIILGQERVNDPDLFGRITSLLKEHLNEDLGGVIVRKVNGRFALEWQLTFIAAARP